jgi:hypothetical protein
MYLGLHLSKPESVHATFCEGQGITERFFNLVCRHYLCGSYSFNLRQDYATYLYSHSMLKLLHKISCVFYMENLHYPGSRHRM